ncbi:BSP-domain-containing protein [Hypomontagnella submonticulosa]|nr:BSP-domain-containing protein [Hypomontagnella submonticulosa]
MSYSDIISNIPETKNLRIHLSISQAREDADTSSSMSLPPNTTPVPQPFSPGMSSRDEAPTPTPSAIPIRPNRKPTSEAETKAGDKESDFELPRLRLHVQDIGHPGASIFLSSVSAATILQHGVQAIHKHLYTGPLSPSPDPYSTSSSHLTRLQPPPTRSVTLVLRSMDGVAYTTGTDLDNDHKEIHFALPYIGRISPPSRYLAEITGVVVHELVHCYQWNGQGTAPGGLIEGVADWVRLRSNLAPPHWNRSEAPARWDVGYQGTAYFLEYLEGRFGSGVVRRLNEKLRKDRYEESTFWTELVGWPVERLFEDYKKTLQKDESEI